MRCWVVQDLMACLQCAEEMLRFEVEIKFTKCTEQMDLVCAELS